jgi:hypothetical protein
MIAYLLRTSNWTFFYECWGRFLSPGTTKTLSTDEFKAKSLNRFLAGLKLIPVHIKSNPILSELLSLFL